MQALPEHHFRLPTEELLGQGVVGHAVVWAGRHFRLECNPDVVTHVAQDFLRGIEDADALHGAEIDSGAVLDVLGSQDRACDDVIDIGPIADLLAGSPYYERILLNVGATDHGDHGVILSPAWA